MYEMITWTLAGKLAAFIFKSFASNMLLLPLYYDRRKLIKIYNVILGDFVLIVNLVLNLNEIIRKNIYLIAHIIKELGKEFMIQAMQ